MSNLDQASTVSKEAMDNAMRSFSAMTRGFQQIASETTDYTKRSYEQSAKMFEQLSQTKSFDRFVELQNEYAKSAYGEWVAQAQKMGELYGAIAKDVYQPFEAALKQAANAGQNAMQQAA